jgi:hypothetical protein
VRVDNDDDDFRERHVGGATQQHVERNRLVGRVGREAVAAGQIEDGHATSVRPPIGAFDTLDRHAREIGDALTHAGQRIEERRLAGVRVADERYAQRAVMDGVSVYRRDYGRARASGRADGHDESGITVMAAATAAPIARREPRTWRRRPLRESTTATFAPS